MQRSVRLRADEQMTSLPVRLFNTLCVSQWHKHTHTDTHTHSHTVVWSAEEEEEVTPEAGNWDVSYPLNVRSGSAAAAKGKGDGGAAGRDEGEKKKITQSLK